VPRGDLDPALQQVLRDLPEDLLSRLLTRIRRGDKRGRPFGTPANPKTPTLSEFNPRIERIRAGDLDAQIVGRKHGQFPAQEAAIRTLSNEQLVELRLDDPISASRGEGGLSLTGGHHRTAEIARRAADGSMPADTVVEVLVHD
jgi:hypothetical protein